ncbi:hypothetical protein COE89_10955 [Bacillus wiedmannii]|nr:hypothetical protein COE89_10955 [Bacillus wiedmannii]
MSNFKYYRRNLKLHEVEFEILLVVFEIRVKINKRFLLMYRRNLLFIHFRLILFCKYTFERSIDCI